jgi:hypothetical protein
VASELHQCRKSSLLIVKILMVLMVGVLLVLSLSWEVMDWMGWELDFWATWQKDLPLWILNRTVKLYQVLAVWYTLGSPVNIVMNVAMVFFAMVVMSLYFSWRDLNRRLKSDLSYFLNDFEADWERLRQLVERADDHFSVAVFISWSADIVCAVGYLGSVIIYGGGTPTEQSYTVLGFFIHAIWNPGCYLIPCILFDEEVGVAFTTSTCRSELCSDVICLIR